MNYARGTIDDNETFFTSDLRRRSSAGLPTEWDIVVVTDWMVARLARLGWLETINTGRHAELPGEPPRQYNGRSFDPDTNLAAPWQSGMTGIGYDKAVTGDLTSLAVFWDDAYEGRMTYLDELRDTVGLAALKLGFDPATLTEDQFSNRWPRWTRPSRPASPARSPATTTPRSWRRATPWSAWPGPAT